MALHHNGLRPTNEANAIMSTKDSNGTELSDGDTVLLIKDLKLKGTSTTLKRGTSYKGIRLTASDEEIECGKGKSTIVLKTCFVKKAI